MVAQAGGVRPRVAAPHHIGDEPAVGIFVDNNGGPLDRVGVNDNFFALGGDSLSATRAIARVQQELQVDVPLKAMFEATTLGELSDRIGLLGWVNAAPLAAEAEASLEEGII